MTAPFAFLRPETTFACNAICRGLARFGKDMP
ncbi:hypothetical protein SAMN06265221_102276 [Paracoccus laeviglucosivorans]|uniref:Uncharacterized protein n=1 Tax=Paracoccus laeviglucosivorans TaxID=1197861 RepID=A0A521BFY6_9RHOB|nr:hypothetical protein SAMN06265221_102276 [Paracoccus laeviglucosivorans]